MTCVVICEICKSMHLVKITRYMVCTVILHIRTTYVAYNYTHTVEPVNQDT